MREIYLRWTCLFIVVGLVSVGGAATSFEGRWKLADDGSCYLDLTDDGPDQCSASPGRWKLGGDGSCYWDDDDSGPNQCAPAPFGVLPDHQTNEATIEAGEVPAPPLALQ
jgi:hypothetical protein